MPSLNNDGEIKINQKEQDALQFLLINANAYFDSKKELTDIDKRAIELSSDLSNLIYIRHKNDCRRTK